MNAALLLVLSGCLIATGVTLIWRDVHGRRRSSAGFFRRLKGEPTAQSGAGEHGTVLAAAADQPQPMASELADTLPARLAELAEPTRDDGPAPLPQWQTLHPVICTAADQVNAVLAAAGVTMGTPGEPYWSRDQAYGSDRRISSGGQAFATLRVASTADGRLNVAVSAREPALSAQIEAEASALAHGATPASVSELLSKCMKPVAGYAMRAQPELAEQAGKALETLVLPALKVGSGALSLAGASLVPLASPVWQAGLGFHRMPVAVQLYGADIARMHIDRREEDIEIAVGLPDRRLLALGRRERVPLEGATIHALAEAIASCAWPAIARYRETSNSFGRSQRAR